MNLLGKISLALSLLCFMLTFGFKMAISGWMPFLGFGLGFGVFFLVFALAVNIKFLRSFLKSESLHFLGKSFLTFIMVVMIVGLLNFIVYKKNWLLDATSNKIHSLPALTKALVKAMPEPLTFYYFHVGNEKVRGFESTVRESLQPYMDLNSQVHLKSYNVFKRPDLSQKFQVGDEESSLFAEYKGRVQRVAALNETAITNSLLKLTKPAKKIYFIQTHDERSLLDSSTFGLKGVNDQLKRLHYEVSTLDSMEVIPEDSAMLVMVGPRRPLSEVEKKTLKAYLSSGGALMIAADPGEDHKLNDFLVDYGLKLSSNFVFSSQPQASQSELLVLTHAGKSAHEVARNLTPGQNPVLFVSSTVEILDGSHTENLRVEPILEHLPNSVGRADIDKKSKVVTQGQQIAAAISQGIGDNFYRLALIGDSDFLTNQFYARPGNFDFALSLIAFLSKDEDLLKLKVPVAETTYLIMTQTQLNLYILFFILPFIALFFVAALFFKLRRLF